MGALPGVKNDLLLVSWTKTRKSRVRNLSSRNSRGGLRSNMPKGIEMHLSADQPRLAQPDDPASKYPIGVATSTELSNVVAFEGISERKDFLLDPRTNLTVTQVRESP